MLNDRNGFKYLAAYCCLAAVGYLLYRVGIGGIFMLDDFPSMEGLSTIEGGILDNSFWAYVFNGVGFPGRPLALFTFALQRECWPTDAGCFQLVNVILHALNGVLIALFGKEIFARLNPSASVILGGLLGLIWVTAPIHISSVLYTVQRMNVLAGTFIILGMWITSLYATRYVNAGCKSKIISVSFLVLIYALTALSIMSKENGVLLSLFSILILAFAVDDERKDSSYKFVKYCMLIPFSSFILYVVIEWGEIVQGYDRRPFDLIQRFATQFSVIYDYIKVSIFPRPDDLGLFHDDYPLIGSIFESGKALFLACAVIVIPILWFFNRKNIILWGVVFYLCGHVIESTVLPLEIYFEHRNYIPLVGLYAAVIYLAYFVYSRIGSSIIRSLMRVLFSVFLAIWIAIAYSEISQWSKPILQANNWYTSHPSSLRALGHYGSIVANVISPEKAESLSVDHYQNYGDVTALLFARDYNCESAARSYWDTSEINKGLTSVNFNYGIFVSIQSIIHKKVEGECQGVTFYEIDSWLDALLENKNFRSKKIEIGILKSRAFLARGDFKGSVEMLLSQSKDSGRIDLLVGAAQGAILANEYELAERLLAIIEERCNTISNSCMNVEQSIDMVREGLSERQDQIGQ